MGVLLCLQVLSLSLSLSPSLSLSLSPSLSLSLMQARTHAHTLLHGEIFFTRLSREKRHHEITSYKAETASLEHAMVHTILYRNQRRERESEKNKNKTGQDNMSSF